MQKKEKISLENLKPSVLNFSQNRLEKTENQTLGYKQLLYLLIYAIKLIK